jgi:hypothetical protein
MRMAVVSLLAVSCASTLPTPPRSAHVSEELIEVPSVPPTPHAEMIPPSPDSRAVWVDGGWTWTGRRWSWQRGAWVIAPAGATYAPWIVVVSADAKLFFAPGVWKDAHGAAIEAPTALASANQRRATP